MSVRIVYKNVPLEFDHAPDPEEAEACYQAHVKGISSVVDSIPLSRAQRSLWVSGCSREGDPRAVSVAVDLIGPLDVTRLQRALSDVVKRQSALRSVVRVSNGAVSQLILPSADVHLLTAEATPVPGETPRDAVLRTASSLPRPRLDPARAPSCRFALFRVGPQEHVLLIEILHLFADGASMGIVLDEIAAGYAGKELPPLLADPAGMPEAEIRQTTASQGSDHLAYWRATLDGCEPAERLDLGPVQPGPREGSRWHRQTLPADTAQRVRSAAAARGTTPFTILMAALVGIQARITERDEVVVAVPMAARAGRATRGLVGCYLSMVPVRVQLWGDPSGAELIDRVSVAASGGYEHAQSDIESVLSDMGGLRGIVHTVIGYQDSPFESQAWGTLEARPWQPPEPRHDYPLNVEILREGRDIVVNWQYHDDVFDSGSIARLAQWFGTMVHVLAGKPEKRLSELEYMSTAEQAYVCGGWRPSVRTFEVADGLATRFAEVARAYKDSVAVSGGEVRLTYGQLDVAGNRLAHTLLARAVRPGDRIAILVPRGIGQIVSVLGVLKAGCTYVPIDPDYPADRVRFILRDCGARVMIIDQKSFPGSLEAEGIETVAWNAEDAPHAAPDLTEDLNSSAYVLYTSGSTGHPKGVCVSHRNVLRLFMACEQAVGISPDDVWAMFHSLSFDVSVWEMWGALLHGGRLVMVPFMTSRTPALLDALLRDEGVTVLSQTPSAFSGYQDVAIRKQPPERLRVVVFGGEVLYPAAIEPWLSRFGATRPRLVNLYGITEATVHSTAHSIGMDDLSEPHVSRIGRPLLDVEVFVLDRAGRTVGIGIWGELYVGGAGVAQGYLGRDNLTAERFVQAQIPGRSAVRLYRSGDVGRILPSGELQYLGRRDSQVKVRGFRVEPEEIRCALTALPAVRDAAVIARGTSLFAYVVPDLLSLRSGGGSIPDCRAIRASLREKLPSYMVPDQMRVIGKLPVTVNGKTDLEQLAKLSAADEAGPPSAESENAAPLRGHLEETIAQVWRDTLGLDRISPDDDFFDVGGQSILALQVATRLAEDGFTVEVGDIFRLRTIRALGEALSASGKRATSASPEEEAFLNQAMLAYEHD